MQNDSSSSNRLAPLMDEFVERFRKGERPSVSEYATRHPELAEEIRELFPALAMMEHAGDSDLTANPHGGKVTEDGKVLQQLGDYRIIREVGRGGMGVVYEAEQESLGRHVALKVLPFYALMDPKHLERFHREARAVAQLHHSNIVPVFGVGEHEGVHYYAMQFIQGQGLDDVLDELHVLRADRGKLKGTATAKPISTARDESAASGLLTGNYSESKVATPSADKTGESPSLSSTSGKLPGPNDSSGSNSSDHQYFRSVAHLGAQIADALAYAHEHGVLHRDIKPSNLLLDTHGTVWITDFGLAKTEEENLTRTGDFVGTLRYMAPERFKGWSDPRSDIYSLGLTLYEMLTLCPAFDESDRGRLVKQVTQDTPPRPRRIDPQIPRDLETIVLKAIEKEPYSRYQSAKGVADDLRLYLADKPIEARRTPALERVWLWCRRNPAVASLLATISMLLMVIAVGSTIAAFKLSSERDNALSNLTRAESAELDERAARQQATRNLLNAYLEQARAEQRSDEPGRREKSLVAIRQATRLLASEGTDDDISFDLRNAAIAAYGLSDVTMEKEWPASDSSRFRPMRGAVFTSDLESFAYDLPSGDISLRRMSDNREHVRLSGHGPWFDHRPPKLRISRDGRFLAASGFHADKTNRVQLWNLQSGELVFSQEIGTELLQGGVAFSPVADELAFSDTDAIVLYDWSKEADPRRKEIGFTTTFVEYAPNGRRLAVSGPSQSTRTIHVEGSVAILDLQGDVSPRLLEFPYRCLCASWSPDGKMLAVGGMHGGIHLTDLEADHDDRSVLREHSGPVAVLDFSPSGQRLLSAGADLTTCIWNVANARVELRMPRNYATQFNSEETAIAGGYWGGAISSWKLSSESECRELTARATRHSMRSLTFRHDGELLAASSAFRSWVWRWKQSRLIGSFGEGISQFVRFIPNSEDLYFRDMSHGFGRFNVDDLVAEQKRSVEVFEPGFDYQVKPTEIGPPQITEEPIRTISGFAMNHDGSRLAVVRRFDKVVVFEPNNPNWVRELPGHRNVLQAAMSHDGKWVATSSIYAEDVRVWDVESEEHVATIPTARHEAGLVCFSPDNEWLLVPMNSYQSVRKVGTWNEVRRLPMAGATTPAAFSDDMKLLAVMNDSHVDLYRPRDFELLGKLPSPADEELSTLGSGNGSRLTFNPSGEVLAVASAGGTVQVWDLTRLNLRLKDLGLAWTE